MKLVFDFFPILVFFITFKLFGIYTATAVFIVSSSLQIGIYWLVYRRFESMHWLTFILGITLGSATLFFHDELFIKWKPTALYWAFSTLFLGSQYFTEKPILQRMMETNISLSRSLWLRFNFSWAVFFLMMGFLNLYVVYNFSTNTWVNFKLFGLMGLTLFFVIIQSICMGRHVKDQEQTQ